MTTTRLPSDPLADLWYLLVLSRPRFWLYLAGPVVVAVVYGASAPAALASPLALATAAYFLVPANVFLYGVNDIFDAEIDAENPKKAGDRELRWQGSNLALGAILASGALAVVPAALSPAAAWPWLGGFLLLAVQYSAPPLRLKTTPGLDSLSNVLYVLPGIGAYVALAGELPPTGALVGALLWAMAMHTFSAIPDIEPDREAGIRTTATVLGEMRTYAYCAGVWLLAAVGFGVVDVRFGLLGLLYPATTTVVAASDVSVDRAYWWFPWVNTALGAVLTINGLVGLVPPEQVLPA